MSIGAALDYLGSIGMEAISEYEGAIVMVSHIPDFVSQIRIDEVLDLDSL